MNRALCLALLAVAACDEKSKTPPPPPVEKVAEKVAEKVTEKAPEPEKEPEKVVIDDAMVEKYLGAQKTVLAELKAYVEGAKADLKKVGEKDTLGALDTLNRVNEREKKMKAATDAALAKAGLTKDQYDAVNDAAMELANARALFEAAGGEAGVAKMEAQLKAELAKLPEAERAKAEAEMAEGPKALREMAKAPDARKRYGDAAMDSLDKRYPELKALREELLQMMKDR